MFVFFAIIAASVFAANQDAGPRDIYARLGLPKIEKCDFRIHVGKEGEWTASMTQLYSIEGFTTEDANAYKERLLEDPWDFRLPSISWSKIRENRCQWENKGESDDALELASLLVRVFEVDKCNFLRWDRESFEWKFLRSDHQLSSRDEKKPIGEFASSVALEFILEAVLDVMLLKKGVTRAELDSTEMDLPKIQLVLTTDGSINADAPAEVSEEGKKLTLDLSKFLSDPPEKWSIRIDGL